MKDYFLTLLTASVLGGILAVLASGSSYEKYIKYIASLVCVVIILSPLKSLISAPFTLPDIDEISYESDITATGADDVVASLTVSELDAYIKDILFIEFGINVPLTDIKIEWTDNCLVIKEVTVYLNRHDSNFLQDAEDYLSDTIDKSISVEMLKDTSVAETG